MSYPPPGQEPGPGSPGYPPGQPGYPSGQQPAPQYPGSPPAGQPGPYGGPPGGAYPPTGQPPAWGGGQPPGPPKKTNTALFVVILLVVLAAVGVGAFVLLGGDDAPSETSEGREYVDALIATANDDVPLGDDAWQCLAESYVDELGVEGFSEHATPDEIRDDPEANLEDFGIETSEAQARGLIDRASGCMDLRATTITLFVEGFGLEEEDATCVVDEFSDDDLRGYLATQFSSTTDDDDDFDEQLDAAAGECGLQ